MGTKHKHAEVIKAWADGAEIEYWSRMHECWMPVVDNVPGWGVKEQYRVKPENIVVTRRIEYNYKHHITETCVSSDPNIRYEFTPKGKLVSVEMIK